MIIGKFLDCISTKTVRGCTSCAKEVAEIHFHGYSENDINLCRNCALQLSRKLLEDLCEVITEDRHG